MSRMSRQHLSKCSLPFCSLALRILRHVINAMSLSPTQLILENPFGGRDAEVLLRLTGLGLLIEDIHRQQWDVVDTTLIFDDPDEIEKEERVYRRTEFGNRMVSILG